MSRAASTIQLVIKTSLIKLEGEITLQIKVQAFPSFSPKTIHATVLIAEVIYDKFYPKADPVKILCRYFNEKCARKGGQEGRYFEDVEDL